MIIKETITLTWKMIYDSEYIVFMLRLFHLGWLYFHRNDFLFWSNLSCHGWRLRGSALSSVPVKLHTHLCAFVKWNGCCVQIAFGAFHTNVPSACAHLSWILRYLGREGRRRNLMQKIKRERKEERSAESEVDLV